MHAIVMFLRETRLDFAKQHSWSKEQDNMQNLVRGEDGRSEAIEVLPGNGFAYAWEYEG